MISVAIFMAPQIAITIPVMTTMISSSRMLVMLVMLLICCCCRDDDVVSARPFYAQRIPNGEQVPSPCEPGRSWPGVGHVASSGGGQLNPFGMDFAKAGMSWPAVCALDSDGDGLTNGQELGDPSCQWTVEKPTQLLPAKGHPGIKDAPGTTIDQSMCPKKMDCAAAEEPETRTLEVRMNAEEKIPDKRTTYIAKFFELPDDQKYHAVYFEPVVDNVISAHHFLFYMCDRPVDVNGGKAFEVYKDLTDEGVSSSTSTSDDQQQSATTDGTTGGGGVLADLTGQTMRGASNLLSQLGFRQGAGIVGTLGNVASSGGPAAVDDSVRATESCQRILTGWAIGGDGHCLHPATGHPFGRGVPHSKVGLMILHWDNPEGRVSGETDTTGLRIHYTPKLRQHDQGMMRVGVPMSELSLPPGQPRYLVDDVCPEMCMARLPQIFITGYWLHMHLTGRRIMTRVLRENRVTGRKDEVGRLSDFAFDFARQPFVTLNETITVRGETDTLETVCLFDTTGRTEYTRGGLSAREEMCYTFISYYPAMEGVTKCHSEEWWRCTSWGQVGAAALTAGR